LGGGGEIKKLLRKSNAGEGKGFRGVGSEGTAEAERVELRVISLCKGGKEEIHDAREY